MRPISPVAPHEDCTGVVTCCLVFTSAVSSMYVMLVLTPSGQSTWSMSLLSCSKKTISTNKALNMKKANTDLFRSSIRSAAIRACKQTLQNIAAVSTGLPPVACILPEILEHRWTACASVTNEQFQASYDAHDVTAYRFNLASIFPIIFFIFMLGHVAKLYINVEYP